MKARLILAITDQVSDLELERHYDWVDVEVISPQDKRKLSGYDIIGGQWLDEAEGDKA